MSSSASWSVQKSLVQALKSDVVLSGLLSGQNVFDHVPQRSPWPFVSIGNVASRDLSMSDSESGAEHFVTVHVWSRAKGKKQCYEIMEVVRSILHDSHPTVEGHALVNLRYVSSDVGLDPDGETVHGVMRFRVVTELVA